MDSREVLPVQKLKVSIKRGDADAGDESVIMQFPDLKIDVALSDSSVEDIKSLFDEVFEYVVGKKSIIEFELEDRENDLFNHVSQDIIDQVNAEIKDSESDFIKIWELVES